MLNLRLLSPPFDIEAWTSQKSHGSDASLKFVGTVKVRTD